MADRPCTTRLLPGMARRHGQQGCVGLSADQARDLKNSLRYALTNLSTQFLKIAISGEYPPPRKLQLFLITFFLLLIRPISFCPTYAVKNKQFPAMLLIYMQMISFFSWCPGYCGLYVRLQGQKLVW